MTTMLRRSDKEGIAVAAVVGRELLDRREDHAAALHGEQLAQVGAVVGLYRRLPQQVAAAGEGAEELVVEVVAVRDDDDRRVRHGRVQDDPAGVEGHRQALARALGVPDDADTPVARLAPVGAFRPERPPRLGGDAGPRRLRGAQRLFDGDADGVELVVARHLLDDLRAVVLEDDEVAHQVEEAAFLADAFEHHLQLGDG
jgi:hypothetical protein